MKLTPGDISVVQNIRYQYSEKVAAYSDEHIALTWREFSGSQDYQEDKDRILDWLGD